MVRPWQLLPPLIDMEQSNELKWVTAARALDGYQLELTFNDGQRRIFDCESLINQYKLSTADEWTEVNNVSEFEYTIDNLTPGTGYNVHIQQVCEENELPCGCPLFHRGFVSAL